MCFRHKSKSKMSHEDLQKMVMNVVDGMNRKDDPEYVTHVLQQVIKDYMELCEQKEDLVEELKRAHTEIQHLERSISPLLVRILDLEHANQSLRDAIDTPVQTTQTMILEQMDHLSMQVQKLKFRTGPSTTTTKATTPTPPQRKGRSTSSSWLLF
jgi:cell division septum initiation protein DivIVA